MIYYAADPAWTSDTQESPILTRYPNLYLYGSLIEAYNWLQDNENQSKCTDVFTSEIAAANRASAESEVGEVPEMTGMYAHGY